MDTREDIRHEAWRRMTPATKYELFCSLMDTIWALKEEGIRQKHPMLTEEEVRRSVAELVRNARS